MTDTTVEFETRVLCETEFYYLDISNYDRADETEAPYKVINKDTGVAEFQSFVLPAAKEMLLKLQNALTNLNKEFEEEASKAKTAAAKASIKLVDNTNH